MFNVKTALFLWGKDGPKLNRSLHNEKARYSSNFGYKLQMMVGTGKEYDFTSNFDMLRPFTPQKTELPSQNGEQPIRLQNGLLYTRVEVEQRTHSGDQIGQIK